MDRGGANWRDLHCLFARLASFRPTSFREFGGPWLSQCVQETRGAEFHSDLRLHADTIVVSKATDRNEENYLAFDGTGPAELLRKQGVLCIWVAGLAMEYVRATSVGRTRLEDARRDALEQGQQLPDDLRDLAPAKSPYPVTVSDEVKKDSEELRDELNSSRHRTGK